MVPEAQRWGRPGATQASTRHYRKLSPAAGGHCALDPSALACFCCCWLEDKHHPADCFHRCQASRPTEPFGKVNRKLSSQIKDAPNYQSQVTTLFLQTEESMTVKKHICNQVPQKSQ